MGEISNGMIKRAVMVGGVLMFWAHSVQAQVTFQTFGAEIAVNHDASITVTEDISVRFDEPRHGIFRVIPYHYSLPNGNTASIPITITNVVQDGADVQYTTLTDRQNLTVKIGDPNETITGIHTYRLVYTAEAAVNFFSDHDELYWNVTGNDWPTMFQRVSAVVHLPSTYDASLVKTTCYTGPVESKNQNCQVSNDTTSATFSSQDFLTIVVGWPTGVVVKPANYDQLRAQAAQPTGLFRSAVGQLVVNVLLPILAGLVLLRHWRKHGRDPQSKRTIIAQYDPPNNLTPGEMGVIVDERANTRDIIATIIDLAVHGRLTITELAEQKFLGLGQTKDYQLTKIKTPPQKRELQPHEAALLENLFADGQSVKLSDLKGTFADDLHQSQSDLYDQVVSQGYFVSNPNTVRIKFIIAGVSVIALGFLTSAVGIFTPFIIGAMILIYAPLMPKRTALGVEAAWHARGFKLFLATAEKYRLQWQERENIFEEYLPYAMVFGVADKWSKAFAGLQQPPPSWYHGAGGAQFNSIVLWSALNNFSTVSAKSFSPPAASGASGFGGGGFSGGGGGGGGGGGW